MKLYRWTSAMLTLMSNKRDMDTGLRRLKQSSFDSGDQREKKKKIKFKLNMQFELLPFKLIGKTKKLGGFRYTAFRAH